MKPFPLQNDFTGKPHTHPTLRINRKVPTSGILRSASEGDRAAIKECIDRYGDLIWAMAKRFTRSSRDAESVTREIFLEIWCCAARFEQPGFDERLFITFIARRRLKNYAEKSAR
jgi:RNA polymerase sigma-70 factor (ECF subfamily)